MVSVIIPYYKAQDWILTTLDSCLEQGEFLHEIIIVDDNSPDNGISLIQDYISRYPQTIKLFKNPKKGGNSARNYGFEHATGKYIQWLDADDILIEGKFKKQINCLINKEADICYSDWRIDYYSVDGEILELKEKYCSDKKDYCEELLKDNWTSNNNYLLTYDAAKLIVKNNGWNELTKVGQDREYFTLGALFGLKFVYQSGVFSAYKMVNTTSVSKMSFNERLELNQVLEARFYSVIQNLEDLDKKKFYSRIIYTHHVKSIFYNKNIKLSYKFNIWSVVWDMIHWKMRLVIPFVLTKAKLIRLIEK